MRKDTKKVDIIIIAVVILLIVSGLLLVILPQKTQPKNGDLAVTGKVALSDFNGKQAGMLTGSVHDKIIGRRLPDSEISVFNNTPDLIEALNSGKIQYFLANEGKAQALIKDNQELAYIDIPGETLEKAAMFAKTAEGDKLRGEFDAFITKLKNERTLDEIYRYWQSDEAEGKCVDMSELDDVNGTIILANDTVDPPLSFVSGGGFGGVEPDIMVRFCKEYGYGLELIPLEPQSMIPGLTTGIYDIGMGDVIITDERKESVNFSVPYNSDEMVLVSLKEAVYLHGSVPKITSISVLNDPRYKVGVGLGTSGFFTAKDVIPNAQIIIVNDHFSAYEAVSKGIYDAYIYDRLQMQLAIDNGIAGVTLLDEDFGDDVEIAVGLSRATKIPDLKKKIDKFLAEAEADGTNDDAQRRWASEHDYTMPEIKPAENPTFKLRVGTCGIVEPYSFYEGSALTGYDIEMAKRFAAWLGADIEFKVYDYPGLSAAANSGDVDCIFANLMVTEEAKEVMDFSDPMFIMHDAVMVDLEDGPVNEDVSFIHSVINSFEKNFIREERWKLILEGIGTTCLITALSAIFGSILAFLICMFRRTGSILANGISNIYVKLLQGTPIVVLLMILYYVILGKTGLEAIWVAIIAFTLNFGAYASEIMRSGIESIDNGQREAALALGYNENQTFFRFIFPQAAARFIPVYKQEIVSLLKSTSIVGYIAIQDLTKMSDIIRSRTYEAFFPLIATAIIYFILAWIISLLLKLVLKAFDKRGRTAK